MLTLERGKQLAAGALGVALAVVLQAGPSSAADFVKVGTCLVGNCPVQLAKCIADPTCAQNIACLQNCNGREDESECQIRCGDLYASPAVEEFTKCAVSDKGCVPQRKDGDREYPIPPDRDLVTNFDLSEFKGQWSITAGLNSLFDIFDCQVHEFSQLGTSDLKADIRWRIKESNGDFIERSAVQTFHQDPRKPGYLRNDKNDFLNYTDDWYIIGYKPDAYAVIYYRGNNDAWEGYGGLTVYSRDLAFPERYRGEINQVLSKLKLNMDELSLVDNSCPPHPNESALQKVEGAIKDVNPKEVTPEEPPIDVRD